MTKLKIKSWHVFLALLMIVGVFAFSKGALPFSMTGLDVIKVQFTDTPAYGLQGGEYWKVELVMNGIGGSKLILRKGQEFEINETAKAIAQQDVYLNIEQGQPYTTAGTISLQPPIRIPYSREFFPPYYIYFPANAVKLMQGVTSIPFTASITGAVTSPAKSYLISPGIQKFETIQTSKGTIGIEKIAQLPQGYNPSHTADYILVIDPRTEKHIYDKSEFLLGINEWEKKLALCNELIDFTPVEIFHGVQRTVICEGFIFGRWSWSGLVGMVEDKAIAIPPLGNPFNENIDFTTEGVRITHPRFSLSGNIVIWIPKDMADTIIEYIDVATPEIVSVTLGSEKIKASDSTTLSVVVKNIGSDGEITVIPSSDGRLQFAPLSDMRSINRNGLATYKFTVRSTGLSADYCSDILVTAWGFGGQVQKTLKLCIKGSQLPPTITPPPTIPPPTPTTEIAVKIEQSKITFSGNNKYAGSVLGIGLEPVDIESGITANIGNLISLGDIEYIIELPLHYKFSLITTDKDADAIGYTILLKFNVVSASPMKVYKGGELIVENTTEFNYLNKVVILGFFVAISGIAFFALRKPKRRKVVKR